MAFDSLETPFGKAERIIGGAATYIGLSASYFTQNISLVSVIGNDFPVATLSDLQSRGMSLEGVEQRMDEKSFF